MLGGSAAAASPATCVVGQVLVRVCLLRSPLGLATLFSCDDAPCMNGMGASARRRQRRWLASAKFHQMTAVTVVRATPPPPKQVSGKAPRLSIAWSNYGLKTNSWRSDEAQLPRPASICCGNALTMTQ